jgi:hypothetical protein
MNQDGRPDELAQDWTLPTEESEWLSQKTDATRLRLTILFKAFQR